MSKCYAGRRRQLLQSKVGRFQQGSGLDIEHPPSPQITSSQPRVLEAGVCLPIMPPISLIHTRVSRRSCVCVARVRRHARFCLHVVCL